MVEGIPSLKNECATCEGCALGKQHREEFPTHTDKIKRDILELINTYVCGALRTNSLRGASFFFNFY